MNFQSPVKCIVHYSEKKGDLQNPLSYKKGSALYPMTEPLKNGSAEEKKVSADGVRTILFCPEPFFLVQNHFSGVLSSGTMQNLFL
jgi:hypothetical protein